MTVKARADNLQVMNLVERIDEQLAGSRYSWWPDDKRDELLALLLDLREALQDSPHSVQEEQV